MKSIISSICAIIVLILYSPVACYTDAPSASNLSSYHCNPSDATKPERGTTTNATSDLLHNTNTTLNCTGLPEMPTDTFNNVLFAETVLSIVMLIGLVWMLNREFEKTYRVTFHCSRLSAKDRKQILNLKNQADWLLHNIIPQHVHESLKR